MQINIACILKAIRALLEKASRVEQLEKEIIKLRKEIAELRDIIQQIEDALEAVPEAATIAFRSIGGERDK